MMKKTILQFGILLCEYCHVKFSGRKKLRNHMCRNHVKNPSWGDFYMKNWFVKNECVRVFSEQQQKEVATIHSELCVENRSCSFLPSSFKSQHIFKDDQDLIHLPASMYFKENLFTGFEVKWETLASMLNTPGTASGPGGRDRTLAVKRRKKRPKIRFFSLKNKNYLKYSRDCGWPRRP